MEPKMPKTPPEQEHQRLDASVTHTDRERSTGNASQSSDDAGLVVVLWLLALLIAEIEFWMLAFAHMYRT
jgi:hypothetical protein